MDLIEAFKVGGPPLVYLICAAVALRRVDALHEERLGDKVESHEAEKKALKAGYDALILLHEARLQAVEASADECRSDRKVLRESLRRLQARIDASQGPQVGPEIPVSDPAPSSQEEA